ncbi:MAG: hypothetical protein ACI978_001281, partial [Oleispira sp.]
MPDNTNSIDAQNPSELIASSNHDSSG